MIFTTRIEKVIDVSKLVLNDFDQLFEYLRLLTAVAKRRFGDQVNFFFSPGLLIRRLLHNNKTIMRMGKGKYPKKNIQEFTLLLSKI